MDEKSSSPPPVPTDVHWEYAGALILALLAFGLRLHQLGFQPLWGDEGWSFYFASMNFGQMFHLTADDIHPPLYYALLGGWLRLVGSTPEVARYLSICFGTLLVPLSYRAAARLFDRIAGLATAAVVTVSPFAIYYSQEVRMYALVTLLGLGSVYFFIQLIADQTTDSERSTIQDRSSVKYSLGYVLTTTAAMYTMYYAIFIPLFQLIYSFAVNPRRKPGDAISHPFIYSLSAVVLLYLPWVIFTGTKLVTYVQGKRSAEGYIPLGLFNFVASHLTAFSLGHLSDATHVLAWAAFFFLPLALLGLVYHPPRTADHALRTPARRAGASVAHRASRIPFPSLLVALYLVIPLSLGYLINLVYPFIPRDFERTLMLAAPGWWLLLGAGLAWLWHRSRLVLVGVGAVALLIQTVMLFDFYNTLRYQDENYRSLLAYVRAHSSPDDTFLASYQWQVGFYYAYLPTPRPELNIVPDWGETWAANPNRMRADLDILVEDHHRVWFPAYQALGRLWETQVETYLNQSAYPVQIDWSLPSTKLLLYAQGDQLAPAEASFNFANRLLAERAEIGDAPLEAGQGVIPITLVWRKLDTLGSDHRIALRLTDASGRTWASRDSLPQGGEASFTALATGERIVDRHGLAVPAGTPPGEYQLRLSVYDQANDRPLDLLDSQDQPEGVEAILSTVQVVPPETPLSPDALPVQHRSTFDFDQRVRLLGYSLGHGPFRAGEPLTFSLFWQALSEDNKPYVVFAQLQDEAGKPVALSEAPPIYPSDRWSAGTLLRDPHQIPLPATLPAGTYQLVIGLLRPDQSRLPMGRDDQVVLTRVGTTQRPHNFSAPSPPHPMSARFGDSAQLVGYDLRGGMDAHPGQSLTLILYWQALDTFDRPYTVFAHLVDADGHIFGQRDQTPGNGDLPTSSWIPDEYLTDAYAIPVKSDTPPGDYWIEVGFYDPVDGARLPVTDANGRSLGDRLLLEDTPIRVE
jgi:hypothetical protein